MNMNKLVQNKFNKERGDVVRKILEEREFSGLKFSEISNVNEKHLGKIEQGKYNASAFILKKNSNRT
jgi:hypothetical protein